MRGLKFSSRRRLSMSVGFGTAIVLVIIPWNSVARPQADSQDPAVERGRKQFGQSCGFCHGPDATGARGPDLVRSPLVAHDVKGDQIGEVIRRGRPDKGMPPLANMTDEQVADIAAFCTSAPKNRWNPPVFQNPIPSKN